MTGQTGPYLLAVDAGTGSCRALLFSVAGEQVAVLLREWAHREPPGVPGGQDFDVSANWLLISACIRDALQIAGATGDDVAAVASTSMREGIVLYDARGHRVATFEPEPAAVAAYQESYARWLELYPRMLELSEDGLLNPLWRAAGAPSRPSAAATGGSTVSQRRPES